MNHEWHFFVVLLEVVTLNTCFDGGKGGAFPAWVIGIIVYCLLQLTKKQVVALKYGES